jgi:pre-mRNA-splicing factor CWC22
VVHEVLAMQIILELLEGKEDPATGERRPTNDGIEVAVDFLKEVGAFLQDISPAALNTIFDRLRWGAGADGWVGCAARACVCSVCARVG